MDVGGAKERLCWSSRRRRGCILDVCIWGGGVELFVTGFAESDTHAQHSGRLSEDRGDEAKRNQLENKNKGERKNLKERNQGKERKGRRAGTRREKEVT